MNNEQEKVQIPDSSGGMRHGYLTIDERDRFLTFHRESEERTIGVSHAPMWGRQTFHRTGEWQINPRLPEGWNFDLPECAREHGDDTIKWLLDNNMLHGVTRSG